MRSNSWAACSWRVVLTPERKQIHLDPKVFDAYVGTYELQPNSTLTISCDGEHFMLQESGEEKVEIFPESDHDFFAKADEIQARFHTDSEGKAAELVLHELAETPVGFFPADHQAKRVK